GFAETDNEEILGARKTFTELRAKFKAELEPEAKKVLEAGGLFIIGTERHESRRIDNQLRGRAGRQGDVGNSRFYVSLEDDLMRLFGGERIYRMLETLKIDDNVPLDMKMLSKTIESAQQKIELRNFTQRKNVLDYDDVMNVQRTIIYQERNKVLDGDDLKDTVQKMVSDCIRLICSQYLNGQSADDFNFDGLISNFSTWLPEAVEIINQQKSDMNSVSLESVYDAVNEAALARYEEREADIGSDLMREVERMILLRSVDTHWMEHIDAMEELRNGIRLRAYGQHDPVVEYRNEGYDMFSEMNESIREETAKRILNVHVQREEDVKREQVAKVTGESGGDDGTVKKQPVKVGKKVGRNDPCPCGSGKKYKKCCGRDD
ncbi:MAG: SEC-C metal-binding domain-containing protein, partial [Acutalibacteraceae bacterium]